MQAITTNGLDIAKLVTLPVDADWSSAGLPPTLRDTISGPCLGTRPMGSRNANCAFATRCDLLAP